jgi:hypothetical protein
LDLLSLETFCLRRVVGEFSKTTPWMRTVNTVLAFCVAFLLER